jgi:hypothetical protein
MRNAGLWLAVASLMGTASALAADAQVEAGRQCAQVKDSLQRLVCYDRVFLAGESAAPAATSPAPVATRVTPVPAPAVAAPAAPAVAAAPSLGEERVQRKTQEKPAEPASLEATVTALKETRPAVFRLTLDNGQVWQQMDMSSVFQVDVGDKVRIEKGTMGGYRLTRSSRGRSGWVRVTRLD